MNLKDIQKRYIRAKYNFLGFDDWQIAEIVEGFLDGFNKKQISIYAQKYFNYNQIREIKSGLKEGLSIEQILLYAKPQFNHYQMRSIYQGLMNKLSEQEIQIFADEKYTYQQMNIIREGLEEGLSIEQVSTYANANFNIKKMKNIRNLLYLENNLPEEEKIILDSNDFWTVIYTKYPYNDEPQETVRILNKELLEEIKNEIHAEVLAFEKHYDLFDSNEFYLAQFEHFVNHESVYTKNISNIEHVENTLENFRNLEMELNKSGQTAKNESLAHEEEEGMEKKQTDESKLAFMNITEKQILKTITKESKNTPGKTYNMCLIILSHGDFKGKAMWVFENQIKKHKTQHRAEEGVITWYVSLPINKPIKLFQYEKEADSDKHIIASTITIKDIEAFTENIKSAKTLEHEKYTQSLKEQQKHFDEQLEQIEDLER